MSMESLSYNIGTIGLWHLGEVFSVGLAELGHTVIGYDPNKDVIENLQKGTPPIAEPDIEELIQSNVEAKRLSFTNTLSDLGNCDIVWITFDTPVNEQDEPDTSIIFDTIKEYALMAKDGVLIVVTSQVPVGCTKELEELLNNLNPNINFDIAYVPENLQLGVAMKSFFDPSRIVIGANDKETQAKVESVFQKVDAEFLKMDRASAEISKHALNAFLATSLSFIHDIADICEVNEGDILEVSKALKADPRIGKRAYLNAGIGFAGGTLGRDLSTLLARAKKAHITLPVIAAAQVKNRERIHVVARRLIKLSGGVENKTIGVFGLTYKPGTPTLRRSLALEIIKELKQAGAHIRTHDPMASADEIRALGIDFFSDPYEAAQNCDVFILATDWPEFSSLDYEKIFASMSEKPLLFDTKNFLAPKEEELRNMGFTYVGIGR